MTTTLLPNTWRELLRSDTSETEVPQSPARGLTQRNVLHLALVLVVAHACVIAGSSVVPSIAGRYALAQSSHPYFVPAYFAQLYILSPLVVLSACLVVLAPGLLFALAGGYARTSAQWVLFGFPISLVVVSVAAALVQALVGRPLVGAGFIAVGATCSMVALVVLLMRLRRGRMLSWPADCARASAFMLFLPALLLITLAPKFYWENFNGDGVHAFEAARLLLHRSLPFWDHAAGEVAAFPGLTSVLFAFPGSWFIRLFGDVEASARLPYLLYVTLLLAALWAVIDYRRQKPMGVTGLLLLCGALVVYTLVLAFSATYSPYSADIALPATQDTLLMVCFLGFIFAWLSGRLGFMAAFALFTFLSLPNGLLMLGFWAAAVVLAVRPIPWRTIVFCGALLFGFVILSVIAPRVAAALSLPMPGSEYGLAGLVHRFENPEVGNLRRFAFMAVPCGILPAFGLLLWPRQDGIARALTLVTVAIFLFFYVQSGTSLHYFIPAMLLPLVVYWRLRPVVGGRHSFAANSLTLAGLAIALWLSWPGSLALDSNARVVGSSFEVRGSGYAEMKPEAFSRATVLHLAFPYEWNHAVPDSAYGGSPIVWNYYANHEASSTMPRNYVVQPAADAAPPQSNRVGDKNGWALYVRNVSVWQAHRALRPTASVPAAIYTIPHAQKYR